MLEFLKESFLSIFVVGYRINEGAWPATVNADAHKGVAAVAVAEMIVMLTIFMWVQVLSNTHVELSKAAIVLGAAVIYAINYYLLLTKKIGSDFEKRFNRFPKIRRVMLRIVALVAFFGVFALFLMSVPYYQHTFHISPKT